MTMDGTEGSGARIVLSPDEGEMVLMGGLGVRFMIGGDRSGGGFAMVEHPIAPRVLAAPMHTHEHEDEYTYVLEGEFGVQVGEVVRVATAGDLVFKPRGIPDAFWNAGDSPERALFGLRVVRHRGGGRPGLLRAASRIPSVVAPAQATSRTPVLLPATLLRTPRSRDRTARTAATASPGCSAAKEP